MMVDLGEEKGTIDTDEGEWIDNVFDFGERTAYDIMTHSTDMITLSVHSKPEDILHVVRESGLSRFPVFDKDIDDIVGILNTRDFLIALADHKNENLKINQLMRSPYLCLKPYALPCFLKICRQRKYISLLSSTSTARPAVL